MEVQGFQMNDVQPLLNHEQVILQVLMNDPSQFKNLNGRKQVIQFNEKELRDAAHAEVANSILDIDRSVRKRKPLNADEKAQQSRDRNREHAKNTRLRKKAYILKLKQLVEEMKKIKDVEDIERRSFAESVYSKELERKNAVLLFLTYRARNEQDRSKWEQILDENVSLVMPITPYRFFFKNEISGNIRKLSGIDAILADLMSLSIMVESIGIGSVGWKEGMIRNDTLCKLVYHTSKEDTIAAGSTVMCRFILRIEGQEHFGSCYSCLQPGMLSCEFNHMNKIVSIEIIFDVMSFMQQLQRTAGLLPEHSIVPNTLEMALQPSNEIRALVKSDNPFVCLHVNLQFTRFTGFSQSDIENREVLRVLNLNEVDAANLSSVFTRCSTGKGPGSIIISIMNLRSPRGHYSTKCYVKIFPISSDTELLSHLLLTFVNLTFGPNEKLDKDMFSEARQDVTERQNAPPQGGIFSSYQQNNR